MNNTTRGPLIWHPINSENNHPKEWGKYLIYIAYADKEAGPYSYDMDIGYWDGAWSISSLRIKQHSFVFICFWATKPAPIMQWARFESGPYNHGVRFIKGGSDNDSNSSSRSELGDR